MEKKRKEETRTKSKVSHVCLLLQITTLCSVQNIASAVTSVPATATAPNPAALSYRTRPVDVVVAVGEPAVFRCGVPELSPNLTFIFHGSHSNYNLTCPHGHMEDMPQALYGSCEIKDRESVAVWTLRGTSFSDNGTWVTCQQLGNPEEPTAVLHVYDNGTSYSILIGCTIGGFFGILLVFGLSYTILRESQTLQKCFRGKETEDDMITIVTKD